MTKQRTKNIKHSTEKRSYNTFMILVSLFSSLSTRKIKQIHLQHFVLLVNSVKSTLTTNLD